MSFYNFLVLIHIFSAILGLAPGFVLISLIKKPQNLTELKHGFTLRTRLHIYVMIGGSLLIITGLTMGFLNNVLFQQFWYVTNLILFLIALGIGPIFLSPRSKPLKAQLKNQKGDKIPESFNKELKSLFFWERIENTFFLLIITLMILKPFSFKIFLKMFYLI